MNKSYENTCKINKYEYKRFKWYWYYDNDDRLFYVSRTPDFRYFIIVDDEPTFIKGYLYIYNKNQNNSFLSLGIEDANTKSTNYIILDGKLESYMDFIFYQCNTDRKHYIAYGDCLFFDLCINAAPIDGKWYKNLNIDCIVGVYEYDGIRYLVIHSNRDDWISTNLLPGNFYKLTRRPANGKDAHTLYLRAKNSQANA